MHAGEAFDKDETLAQPCDVLIPAAIGGVITEDTAKDVQVGTLPSSCRPMPHNKATLSGWEAVALIPRACRCQLLLKYSCCASILGST